MPKRTSKVARVRAKIRGLISEPIREPDWSVTLKPFFTTSQLNILGPAPRRIKDKLKKLAKFQRIRGHRDLGPGEKEREKILWQAIGKYVGTPLVEKFAGVNTMKKKR